MYIVTGAAGFLGFHLCEKLLRAGSKVIGVDNYITGTRKNVSDLKTAFPNYFQFIEADVSEPWNWMKDCDLNGLTNIFHFASVASPELFEQYSLEIMGANSIGLKNAVDLADQHGSRVIFASTSEIYGSANDQTFSESNWGYVNSYGPRSCYDESKRFGEAFLFSHNRKHTTKHGIVRIFNTYGPRMNANDQRVINHFIRQALANEPLPVYGDGKQTRSFCFVNDLVEAILSYASKNLTEPLNIGNDHEVTVEDLAKIIQQLIPSSSKISFSNKRNDDPLRRKPDLSKALNVLKPWQPRTTLEDGIRMTTKFITGEV